MSRQPKECSAREVRKHSSPQRRACIWLLRVTLSGQMSGLIGADYEVESLMCDKCGMEEDTVHHGVWRCTHDQCVEARKAAAPDWLFAQAVAAGPSSVF